MKETESHLERSERQWSGVWGQLAAGQCCHLTHSAEEEEREEEEEAQCSHLLRGSEFLLPSFYLSIVNVFIYIFIYNFTVDVKFKLLKYLSYGAL